MNQNQNRYDFEERDEKIEGGEIHVDNGFVRWVSNFWYHYKWHVIIIAFFVITFAVGFAQCSQTEQPDVMLTFAGPAVFSSAENQELKTALSDLMPKDFDENGKKTIGLNCFAYYSEQDLEDEREQLLKENPDMDPGAVNSHLAALRNDSYSGYKGYSTYVTSGESAVLFVSQELYENLRDNGRLMKLSEVLDSVPEDTLDGYAMRLTDTYFYRNYNAAKVMPEGTVVCLLHQTILGDISNDTRYGYAKEMFAAIIGKIQ